MKLFKLTIILIIGFFAIGCSSMPPMSSKKPTPFEGTWTNGDLITWTFSGNRLRIVDYENGMAVDGKIRFEDDGRMTYFNEWLCLRLSNMGEGNTNKKFFNDAVKEYSEKYRIVLTSDDIDFSYRYGDGFEERVDKLLEDLNSNPIYERGGISVDVSGEPGSVRLDYSLNGNSLIVKRISSYEGYKPWWFDPAFEGEFIRR